MRIRMTDMLTSARIVLTLLLSLILHNVVCQDDFIIAGYLPDYCTHVNVTNAADFLTDLILFSAKSDATGELGGCCIKDYQYEISHQISRDTKIWVSVGGMGRSEAFPMLSANSAFLDNLLELCQDHSLDGIDLFWDDPKTRQDMEKYSRIIIDAADILHEHGFLLSVTTRQFFPTQVVAKVDRINLMAYDLIQKEGNEQHHAAMESVNIMVDNLIHQGYPSRKIVLGIPAYARHKENPNNVRTFAELVDDGYRDLDQSVYKGYLFDSPGRIKRKVKMAKKKKLGGVVIWELGQDKQVRGAPGGMVLEAAAAGEYKLLDEL